ncbi:MAG TPA: helix-turn-helix domain-containing protein, partial [Leptospiraceae bacterium]|nr:helix-turn-helix domain-containing protein [Leptospiraceae bacterium]
SIDLSKVGEKLKNLMETEKVYREETLSLPELASMIGITPHQLSEYLNQEMKTSFFQLIHRYRIIEAKEKLISNPKETILSIAYSAGYQSKSTFNEIFKKETGLTPTEFRKKSKKTI